MSNEQWKEGGRCDLCRRQKYCKTTCKAAIQKQKYDLNAALEGVLS